jgi:hypothetical protein
MPANGFGICEGRALGNSRLKFYTNADNSTNAQLFPSTLLLQIPCWQQYKLNIISFN